ncbi:hypothetical protein CB1_002582005 [Camelus ferus]|nr:hypothetical protein CB1_002582005 [Camelus ferus]
MAGELGQPQAGPSHAGLDWPNPERNRAGVPGGVIRKVGSPGRRSWIQKILEQITDSPRQWVTPSEVVPVAVLAVQRYLLEDEPRDVEPKPPLYCYDVTISDGVYQEKCYLDPSLNFLVYKNILKVGIEMRISRVSCIYNERRLGQGILCIDDVHCGESLDAISLETPFRNSAHREIPERPLRGGKSHYLALWNNEDPYGDIWLNNKYPEEHNFNKICLNLRDPPTNIMIIPEKQVKPEWRLPKLNYRFITRSELDDMPENHICDVVGILVFVGRVQRSKKKVTYFVCTQLKVVRNDAQVPKLLYLTTTNESRVFINGHRGQPYINDPKVKNFNQWVKAKTDSGELKNTVIGGYYPYPPVPETFSKYSSSVKGREGASSSNRGKARKTISDKWESQMWREKKFGLIDHLRYSRIYPESIPRKFVSEHRNFLARQYNSQPAKYVPPEGRPQKLDDFKSARSLGHFEVTILGLNHEIAIDVAFLPMYSPEDFRASQIATLLSCTNYSCVYSQEVTGSDRLPGPRALAASFSTNAYVTVTYYNETSNHTITETCECGVYGLASPVANAMGVVAIPKNNNYQACNYNTEFTNTKKPWIALIERGNCTFAEKIQIAGRRNADAVVIYNGPETDNQMLQMANFGARDIVAIMIGNLKGTKILQSIQRGIQVTMVIEVGKKHGPWEIGPDGDSCAVCIELYKPNDLVRILTCNHIFHKTCVDPWLLEHRTCPMCKCDILKALGIEVDVEDGSVSLQVPVSSETSNSASPHEEDNRSETASSGYASVQGADEPPLEEHVQSANENLQLVNHEASSIAVDVVPHVVNPTFEEDESPDQETAVQEIKS